MLSQTQRAVYDCQERWPRRSVRSSVQITGKPEPETFTRAGSSYWLCCNEIANPPTGAPTPAPIQATSCDGVLADYIYDGDKSFPGGGTTTYSFNSRLVLSNVGTQHVYKWAAYFNFINNENITSVANAASSPSVFPVSGWCLSCLRKMESF